MKRAILYTLLLLYLALVGWTGNVVLTYPPRMADPTPWKFGGALLERSPNEGQELDAKKDLELVVQDAREARALLEVSKFGVVELDAKSYARFSARPISKTHQYLICDYQSEAYYTRSAVGIDIQGDYGESVSAPMIYCTDKPIKDVQICLREVCCEEERYRAGKGSSQMVFVMSLLGLSGCVGLLCTGRKGCAMSGKLLVCLTLFLPLCYFLPIALFYRDAGHHSLSESFGNTLMRICTVLALAIVALYLWHRIGQRKDAQAESQSSGESQ